MTVNGLCGFKIWIEQQFHFFFFYGKYAIYVYAVIFLKLLIRF